MKIWSEDLSSTNIKFESSRLVNIVHNRCQVFERIKGDVSLVRITESQKKAKYRLRFQEPDLPE